MKKIISLLLSLVMLFTLGSVCVSASDDDVTTDFDDLVGETGFAQVYLSNLWISKGEGAVELYITKNSGIDKIDITLTLPDGVEILSVSDGDMGEAALDNGVITVTAAEEYTEDTCVAKVTLNAGTAGINEVKIDCIAANGEKAVYIAPSTCMLKVGERMGDVDGDGDMDATDLANLKLLLAGSKTEEDENIVNPDVNLDNEVMATDLAQLKLMLSGVEFDSTLKILGVGNSYTVDGTEYLWDVAEYNLGRNLILGRTMIGGCSIDEHWENIQQGNALYQYTKNTNGEWVRGKAEGGLTTMEYALVDEDWDIIVINHNSMYSGNPNTFENLANYVNYLKSHCPNAKIIWQLTWAYEQGLNHAGFPYYNNDQMTMYNAIVDCVETKVVTNEDIYAIIPTGTAIQNLRTSYMGDNLMRDGFHLSLDVGRHTSAMIWYNVITGRSIEDITYVNPEYPITEKEMLAIKDAINKAIANPYEVTQSAYTE